MAKLLDIPDLIATTLPQLDKGQLEVMWDDPDYPFCRVYEQNNRKVSGGVSLVRSVMLDKGGNAKYTEPFATDETGINNSLRQVTIPWTRLTTNYSWEEEEFIANQDSPEGILDLIETRRTEELWALADLLETYGWRTPDSANDTKHPYAVPYFLNFCDNGSSTRGFVGKTIRYYGGTTGTVCAGLDANDPSLAKWRNYADIWTDVGPSLVKKIRQALRATSFKPATIIRSKYGGNKITLPNGIYVDNAVITDMEDFADKRDDNTTPKDLAGTVFADGTVFINKIPVVYAPKLDGYTVKNSSGADVANSPIFGVNWSYIQPTVRSGYWMKEGKPMNDKAQHTVWTVHLDCSHANLCTNRRKAGFALSKYVG